MNKNGIPSQIVADILFSVSHGYLLLDDAMYRKSDIQKIPVGHCWILPPTNVCWQCRGFFLSWQALVRLLRSLNLMAVGLSVGWEIGWEALLARGGLTLWRSAILSYCIGCFGDAYGCSAFSVNCNALWACVGIPTVFQRPLPAPCTTLTAGLCKRLSALSARRLWNSLGPRGPAILEVTAQPSMTPK